MFFLVFFAFNIEWTPFALVSIKAVPTHLGVLGIIPGATLNSQIFGTISGDPSCDWTRSPLPRFIIFSLISLSLNIGHTASLFVACVISVRFLVF